MKPVNATAQKFHPLTIRGQRGLFGDFRVDRDTLPKGIYAYEIVRSTKEDDEPCEMTDHVLINFMGTVLFASPFEKWDETMAATSGETHHAYFKFSDVPEWYENEDGITDDATAEDGTHNEPHFCPLDTEWDLNYDDDEMTITEFMDWIQEHGESEDEANEEDDDGEEDNFSDSYYLGYVYDSDGKYRYVHVIKKDMDTVARFIAMNPECDKTITDVWDMLVLNTFGPFLNQVADQSMVGDLQKTLVPYQTGKKLVPIQFSQREEYYMVQDELVEEWDSHFYGKENDAADRDPEKVKHYESYKLNWMLSHGYSISDMIAEVAKYSEDADPVSGNGVTDLFAQWEQNAGFGGELWACYDEWQENEGTDEGGANA